MSGFSITKEAGYNAMSVGANPCGRLKEQPMPTKSPPDFDIVYAQLKTIMQRYDRPGLHARLDQPENYELIGPPTERSMGKEVWFGAVRKGKRYVSYHLIAVYAFPDLLEGISPELRNACKANPASTSRRLTTNSSQNWPNSLTRVTNDSGKRN